MKHNHSANLPSMPETQLLQPFYRSITRETHTQGYAQSYPHYPQAVHNNFPHERGFPMQHLPMKFAFSAPDQKTGTQTAERKGRKASGLLKRYFIDALGAMALGLFGSLIIGLILKQVFTLIPSPAADSVTKMIISLTAANSPVVGAAIGVAIAHGLKSKPLAI